VVITGECPPNGCLLWSLTSRHPNPSLVLLHTTPPLRLFSSSPPHHLQLQPLPGRHWPDIFSSLTSNQPDTPPSLSPSDDYQKVLPYLPFASQPISYLKFFPACTMPPPCNGTCLGMSNYRFSQCRTRRECPAFGHCLDLLLACALAYLERRAGLIRLPHQHLPTVHFLASQTEEHCASRHTCSLQSYLQSLCSCC
jgi:hypothetical protein